MPLGMCVMRTADSVLLTCWPPAPLERYTSVRRSAGLISMSMSSSISGEMNTEAKEVWRRLPENKRRWPPHPVHAGLGTQPAIGVLAGHLHRRALHAGHFARVRVDDLA